MEQTLALGLVWYVVFLFSTTLHEAGHAWAALKLGDPTAYHGGQVSLNPIPHVRREIFGMVIIPLLTFAWNGWMIGWASAPYDPLWADRHPKRAALMSLAGPAGNLILVLVAGLSIRLGMLLGGLQAPLQITGWHDVTAATSAGPMEGLATMLSVLFSLNLILLTFNLLPIPPLDGSGALPLLMSDEMAARYQNFLRQPMISLLGILIAWRLFGTLFGPIQTLALNLLYPGMGYS